MKKLLVVLALSISIPAFAQMSLKVNGQTISNSELANLTKILESRGLKGAQAKAEAQNILVAEKIIGQEAWKQKVAQEPMVQRILAENRANIYREGLIQKYLKSHPLTQQDLEQAYFKMKKAYNPTEIKVRHILVNTEKEAKDLLYLISAGEDMGKLAQQHTLDKATAKDGGVIPFNNVTRFVIPNFAQTALTLKKGQVLNRPFKSDRGYHVMKLEDMRTVPFPKLEQIKDQVAKQAVQEKASAYIISLYNSANVQGLSKPNAGKAATKANKTAAKKNTTASKQRQTVIMKDLK